MLAAATLGLTLAACGTAPPAAPNADMPNAGMTHPATDTHSDKQVRCWGVNATKAEAKCAISEDDVQAVRLLLGDAFETRFANTQTHKCGKHAACGTTDAVLNWTKLSEGECREKEGMLVEDNPEDSAVMRVARDA
jgi:hypothetical protein